MQNNYYISDMFMLVLIILSHCCFSALLVAIIYSGFIEKSCYEFELSKV